ncbi:hypothetical protein CC86DRAFT_412095 [Ophiobolus disseminans]|uniref:Uncharacterized protein n=1 Tax=Ophiobolus disseminans TaxID=1469910 RepID=A0A6A6ZH62_9PLEO|nr:hypothetical protein CC86DRAFT_412095 [Ophiobolus disseminans]
MSCVLKIFRVCYGKNEKPKTPEQVHHQVDSPTELRPTPDALPEEEEPPRFRHISATLRPRMLAAFPPDADFAQGGDERQATNTFKAIWGAEVLNSINDDLDGVEYEFIYEGKGGITWPLRRVRVDNKPVIVDVPELGYAADADAMDVVLHGDEWQEVELVRAEPTAVEAGTDGKQYDSPMSPSSPVNPIFKQVPRKLRVRVRRMSIVAGSEGENDMPRPLRLKVRVLSARELEEGGTRPLPRRQAVVVLKVVDECATRTEHTVDGEGGDASAISRL